MGPIMPSTPGCYLIAAPSAAAHSQSRSCSQVWDLKDLGLQAAQRIAQVIVLQCTSAV